MDLGPSGSTDLVDWWDNLQASSSSISGGKIVHKGFRDHERRVAECLMGHVNRLQGWKIGVDYIIGHSLGGAAAVVFAQDKMMVRKSGRVNEGCGGTRVVGGVLQEKLVIYSIIIRWDIFFDRPILNSSAFSTSPPPLLHLTPLHF